MRRIKYANTRYNYHDSIHVNGVTSSRFFQQNRFYPQFMTVSMIKILQWSFSQCATRKFVIRFDLWFYINLWSQRAQVCDTTDLWSRVRRFAIDLVSYVIMGVIASQITSLTIVYSTGYSGADQRKHQSSVSLAFVLRIHRWPLEGRHSERDDVSNHQPHHCLRNRLFRRR